MRAAIVGAGLQGSRRASALRLSDGDRLLLVADIDPAAAQRLAHEYGCRATRRWQDVIECEEVDAVLVCTPPDLHTSVTVAALRRGKHVLCEKPLGRNPREASSVLNAARKSGAKIKCGLNHRHHPAVRQARRWCDEGQIGEITFIRSRHGIGGREGYDKEWRARPEISGGGELIDQGVHGLDLARWFLGEFSECFAFLSSSFWEIGPLEDNAFALLRTARGQVASLHASWTEWKNLFCFEVFGKEGYVKVEGLNGSYGTERVVLGKRSPSAPFRERVIEFRGEDRSWAEEWREFVAAIEEDREPLGSGWDGLMASRLTQALYESARTGRAVRPEEVA
jgi:predicted dehydrogenase